MRDSLQEDLGPCSGPPRPVPKLTRSLMPPHGSRNSANRQDVHGVVQDRRRFLTPHRPADCRDPSLAYNLGNVLRQRALPPSVKQWSLTTLRDKLIKIGAKVVHHARYVTFQLAEVAVPRRLYRAILERIRRFAALPPRASPI